MAEITRRNAIGLAAGSALTGASVALAGLAVAASADPPLCIGPATPYVDPHVAWSRAKAAALAEFNGCDDDNDPDEELSERAWAEFDRLRDLILETPPMTVAGAREQLRALIQYYDHGCRPDQVELREVLAALDRVTGRAAHA